MDRLLSDFNSSLLQTAQLRLENSTLSRKSILAEQLVKKYQVEKSDLAKKVEELRKELEQARQARAQGSPYYGTGTLPNGNHISGLCKKVMSYGLSVQMHQATWPLDR